MVHTKCMKVHETDACKNFTNERKFTKICIFCDSFSDLYLTRRVTSKKSVQEWPNLRHSFISTTETLSYNRNLVLQPKPCATTETLCNNRNLLLQPKLCATTKTLCYNRNLVLQPKPCASTVTLCYNRNLVLQPKPCATTETLCTI